MAGKSLLEDAAPSGTTVKQMKSQADEIINAYP
jgi:chromosome transmission fidelity protein 4